MGDVLTPLFPFTSPERCWALPTSCFYFYADSASLLGLGGVPLPWAPTATDSSMAAICRLLGIFHFCVLFFSLLQLDEAA